MDGETTMPILPYILAVMQWLAGKVADSPKRQPLATPRHLIERELAAEKRRAEAVPADQTSIGGSPGTV